MDKQSPSDAGLLARDELLTALDSPAIILDLNGVIVQTNSAAHELCGQGDGASLIGYAIDDLLPDLTQHIQSGGSGFHTQNPIECTVRGRLVQVRTAPIRDVRGEHAGWLVLLLGSDGVQQGQETHVRSLLASLDDLVFVIDLDGQIVEYHQQSSEVYDRVNHLMLGNNYTDVFTEPVARTFSKMMDIVRATGQMQRFDHRFVRNDQEYWYSANIGLLRDADDQVSGYLVVSRNITERKRIETAEREQRVLAEALQDVALALNSTLELDEIWDRILTNVVRVVPADAAAILLVDHGVARVVRERGYAQRGLGEYVSGYEVEVAALDRLQYMSRTQQPCLIPDVGTFQSWLHSESIEISADSVGAADVVSPFAQGDGESNWARSYLGAPIVLDDAAIGFIKLESEVLNHFTDTDADRLRAFGGHAASAIRNARLYAQAQELAAIEERQRLARELHDAVSQMLFSAKIITEMLPRLHKKNPDSVWTYLPELQRLIQGAMGEMRMLLLELRPNILNDVDLRVLLGYLVDAANARTSAKITLSTPGECKVPSAVQVALYRIVQEALANAVKYSHAKNIDISVERLDDVLWLQVVDDGTGFDIQDVRPENLGLDIMQERADEIAAQLTVTSAPAQGARVEVTWSMQAASDKEE